MKTLTVALLFALSLASLRASARAGAQAWSHRIEPRLTQPQSLLPEEAKKGGDTGRGEEDSRALSQRAALAMVDPGVLDDMLRLRAAALASR